MEARDVYLVDHVRTPFSRARPKEPPRDVFSKQWGSELAARTLKELFENRLSSKGSSLTPEDVSEVLVGCSLLQHENSSMGGRIPLFMAKFPVKVPAIGLDKQGGSGMAAIHIGYANIAMGYSDVVVALGYEQTTRVPMSSFGGKVRVYGDPPGKLMLDKESNWYNDDIYDWNTSWNMVQTAQKLAEEEADTFTKEHMDKLATRSHNLAEKALESGFFTDELFSIAGHKEGELDSLLTVDTDQSIRKGATLEKTANLPSVSTPGWEGGYYNPILSKEQYIAKFGTEKGIITAGNSSPMNSGAAACLLMDEKTMEKHNLKPLGKIISIGYAGVDPTVMGRGPVPATQMALKHAGLQVKDIDYWEIDEAFCIVALNAANKLGIDWENKMNIHGGATAIGDPPAPSGLRITGTLAKILREKNAKYGVATICGAGGQGTAIVLENINA